MSCTILPFPRDADSLWHHHWLHNAFLLWSDEQSCRNLRLIRFDVTLFSSKRFSDGSFKHEALPLSNSNSSNETPQLHAIITYRTEYDLYCCVPDRWRPPGILVGKCKKNGPRQFLQWKNEGSEYIMCLGFLKCVKNNEAQGYLFFTPMSRWGPFFFCTCPGVNYGHDRWSTLSRKYSHFHINSFVDMVASRL